MADDASSTPPGSPQGGAPQGGEPQVELAIRRAALEVLADSARGLFMPDNPFIRALSSARTTSGSDGDFLKNYALVCSAFERLDRRLARHLIQQCDQNVTKKRAEILGEVQRICQLAGVTLPGATAIQWFPQAPIKGAARR